MRRLDLKMTITGIFLLTLSIIAFLNWEGLSMIILPILSSKIVTFPYWIFLAIISILHYFGNYENDKNIISEKEGFDKPLDYIQFLLTYGAFGTGIQILSKEVFINLNFKELSKCLEFGKMDIFCFIVVIVVLVFQSYSKVKPIVTEVFVKKEKITTAEK